MQVVHGPPTHPAYGGIDELRLRHSDKGDRAMMTRSQPAGTVENRQLMQHQQSTQTGPGFPARRMRRLRRTESLRQLVRETSLHPADFIYPLFVSETIGEPTPIRSMPGQMQWPLGALAAQARAV